MDKLDEHRISISPNVNPIHKVSSDTIARHLYNIFLSRPDSIEDIQHLTVINNSASNSNGIYIDTYMSKDLYIYAHMISSSSTSSESFIKNIPESFSGCRYYMHTPNVRQNGNGNARYCARSTYLCGQYNIITGFYATQPISFEIHIGPSLMLTCELNAGEYIDLISINKPIMVCCLGFHAITITVLNGDINDLNAIVANIAYDIIHKLMSSSYIFWNSQHNLESTKDINAENNITYMVGMAGNVSIKHIQEIQNIQNINNEHHENAFILKY